MSERTLLLADALGHWVLAWTLVVAVGPQWAQPICRRRRAILALLAFLTIGAAGSLRLIGFAGRAAADEPAGSPLPEVTSKELAAKVREAIERHHYEQGECRYITNFDSTWPDPVTTDATGKFRFDELREGRYTIAITAPGYSDGKVETIPAGTENVAVTLKRP